MPIKNMVPIHVSLLDQGLEWCYHTDIEDQDTPEDLFYGSWNGLPRVS